MTVEDIAERYRTFARQEAHGSSPSLEAWAHGVAADATVLAKISQLPPAKQQPNLVFAAARWCGAEPGDLAGLRELLLQRWEQVRLVIMQRSTQTNEPARGAAILLGLSNIPGPIALVEIGASAGLCLWSDRYSYRFSDEVWLHPTHGPSSVQIEIDLTGHWPREFVMPDIVWRAGLDLNPLDPGDADTRAWLTTLIWPEHEARRRRLEAATAIAAAEQAPIARGNLLTDLPGLVARAPEDATVVVLHSATLAYLDRAERERAVQIIKATGARWLSFEGRGIPGVAEVELDVTPDTLFVAALDGRPYAVSNGHGDRLTIGV